MQNQYEEIIKLKSTIAREQAIELIKDIYCDWFPEENMIVNGLTIMFVANGEKEFGQLANASLDF